MHIWLWLSHMTSPATSPHGPIQTLIQFYAIVKARIFDTVQKLNQSIVPVVVGTYCTCSAAPNGPRSEVHPHLGLSVQNRDGHAGWCGNAHIRTYMRKYSHICANIHIYAQIFTHMRQCECVPNTRKSAATRASFHFRLKSGTDKTQAFPRTFILDVQIFDHGRTQMSREICNVK